MEVLQKLFCNTPFLKGGSAMLKKQKAHKERNIVFLLFTIPGFFII